MGERRKVAVLGATGAVGQRIVQMLEGHPWFELAEVAASEESARKGRYIDAVKSRWLLEGMVPGYAAGLPMKPCRPDAIESDLVFSALDADVAGPIEDAFADAGHYVCSNARNHRMDADVPLVIPEVNPDHLKAIDRQKARRNSSGYIVTDPNCSTTGLVIALKPIHDACGARRAHVVTEQAISGAGYPGVASLDITGNVLPCISGEEEKMASEPRKILGSYGDAFEDLPIDISAHCTRVPVRDGHMEYVTLGVDKPVEVAELKEMLRSFRGRPQELGLPTAPAVPIVVFEADDRPQPIKDAYLGEGRARGMVVSVGRLRGYEFGDGFNYKFIGLSHNTIRGAAGAAILNAELLEAEGYMRR